MNFSNHQSYVAVRTIRMLRNTSKAPLDAGGSKWKMDASRAVKYDREEKSRRKAEKKEKKKVVIKRTTRVPDEKPKIGNHLTKNYN